MLHQLGESGLCHLGILPYLGIACDFPKEMKCFAMTSDKFDHFLGIVDRREENVRDPIEEALDRLDLDLRRFATHILHEVVKGVCGADVAENMRKFGSLVVTYQYHSTN